MFYVTDWRDHVVVEIDRFHRDSTWRQLTPGWPAGALLQPAGMALAEDGRLVVADRGHHRLVVFSADRATASVLAPDGSPLGSLWQPGGVALGPSGELLVADTGNHRVVRCASLDAPAWTAFGTAGRGAGQFVSPSGIAVDGAGRILVADPGASRVVRIADMEGSGWVELPLPAAAATARPYGCAAGLDGILVADPGASRVLLLADDGAGGDTVTTLIDGGAEASLLAPVAALALDGSLFVADAAGASLARFDPAADGGGWILTDRLYGQRSAFPSPLFPRIGGFTAGAPR